MKCITLILSVAIATSVCQASEVKRDILLGIGEMAKCTYSEYPGSDEHGNPPAPDLTVADGWRASASDGLTASNYVFRLVQDQGISYQYLALKGVASGAASISMVPEGDPDPAFTPRSGDTVTFTIDRIHSSDWTGGFIISVSVGIPGIGVPKEIALASTDATVSVAATVPDGATGIAPYLKIWVQGDLGEHQPGVYFSGAHFYIRRAGMQSDEMESVPVVRSRAMATNTFTWRVWDQGIRPVANLYDEVSVAPHYYRFYSTFRKLNPAIRLYLYQVGPYAVDTPTEARWALGPLKLSDVVVNHPDWLYPTSPGASTYKSHPDYPGTYPVHCAVKAFQDLWADTVIAKARSLGVDGIMMDGCGALTIEHEGMLRLPWEVQQYLHAVVPKLRAAGLISVVNQAENNLDGVPGWNGDVGTMYFYPSWVPNEQYPASQGYEPNTAENTPDVFFREYSFAQNNHNYNSVYWLKCLNDPSIVETWNQSLPASLRKRIQSFVKQTNTAGHPAYGVNGWVQFGLASYLLCENSYTSFAVDVLGEGNPAIDFSITTRLGDPEGVHQPYNGDTYFRLRRFGPSVGGAAGGVVVVNGHTDAPRTFKLDFDGTDEQGNQVSDGQEVVLGPNTGRIFLKQKGPVFVRIRTPSDTIAPGETITVTVDYLGSSTESALGVVLRAKVPGEMTYIAGSAETSGGSYDPATNTVSWNIGTVVAGGSGRRVFKARAK